MNSKDSQNTNNFKALVVIHYQTTYYLSLLFYLNDSSILEVIGFNGA